MNGLGFRQSMGLLHSWGGLIAGWIGFAIFLTGTLAVFDDELTRWASPELTVARPAGKADVLAVLRDLDRRSPDYWFASMPSPRTPAMRVMWKDAEGRIERAQVDPAEARPIDARDSGGGHFFTEFHYTLHAGTIGTWIVAAISVAMLAAMLSGIVVHRRIFSDFFTFRPRAAPQRRWLDLHNLIAVLALPFLLMIVYTGLTIKSRSYLPVPNGPRPVAKLAPLAEPPAVPAVPVDLATVLAAAEATLGDGRLAFVTVSERKGARRVVASRAIDDRLNLSTDTATFDRASGALLGTTRVEKPAYLTQRVFAGLHFGQFGGQPTRWLYFILGLGGTVMIGAGLILFSVKRPGRVIPAISVAATGGLIAACVAHLAAARWLPVGMARRETAEAAIFFATWATALLHATGGHWATMLRDQMRVASAGLALLVLCDLPALVRYGDGAVLAVETVMAVLALALWQLARALPAWTAAAPAARPRERRGRA